MTSAAPQSQRDTRPAAAAPGAALAHTPEQAAAIIGGDVKASWLRQKARNGEIPSHWFGKHAFTGADIDEIIAICERPARKASQPAPAAPAPAKRAQGKRAAADTLPPAPAAGVIQLRAREPRKRSTAV
jgi:hypothetical protein